MAWCLDHFVLYASSLSVELDVDHLFLSELAVTGGVDDLDTVIVYAVQGEARNIIV